MTIKDIKEEAKIEMTGNRLILIVGFVVTLVSWTTVTQILLSIFKQFVNGGEIYQYVSLLIVALFLFLLGDFLRSSYYWFGLDFLKGKKIEIKDVFQAFKKENIKSLLSLITLRAIVVFLWSLLFVIPGIWKTYLYSQAPNYLKEDAKLTSMEALKKSEEQMKGHIFNYMILQLTFLPWYALPGGFLAYYLWANKYELKVALEVGGEAMKVALGITLLIFAFIGVIILLFSLYVEPYKMVSKQIFYKEIKINTRKRGE